MEEIATKTFLEYGLVGAFALLGWGTAAYLFRQLNKERDKCLEFVIALQEKTSGVLSDVSSALAVVSTKLDQK